MEHIFRTVPKRSGAVDAPLFGTAAGSARRRVGRVNILSIARFSAVIATTGLRSGKTSPKLEAEAGLWDIVMATRSREVFNRPISQKTPALPVVITDKHRTYIYRLRS